MGLLQKALILDRTKERKNSNDFSPDIKNMINILESEQKGLDFPSILFSHIKKDFHIKKGALLLPGTDTHFVPWAETGFDRTTSRRIRIPVSIIENIQKWEEFNIVQLKGSEMEVMREYFSFREFSVTEKVLIAPIISEKKVIALLFISDGRALTSPHHEVFDIFRKLSREAGPLLFRKRDTILNKLGDIPSSNENDEMTINRFIQYMGNNRFLLLSLELINFIDSINHNDPHSITYRIKQDIVRLVRNLISEKGEVIDTGGSTVLILLKGDRTEEAELFVHQIGISLGYFYNHSNSTFKPEYSIKAYPDDGVTTEELLDSLMIK